MRLINILILMAACEPNATVPSDEGLIKQAGKIPFVVCGDVDQSLFKVFNVNRAVDPMPKFRVCRSNVAAFVCIGAAHEAYGWVICDRLDKLTALATSAKEVPVVP